MQYGSFSEKFISKDWKFYISDGQKLIHTNISIALTKYSKIQILDGNKDNKSDIISLDNNYEEILYNYVPDYGFYPIIEYEDYVNLHISSSNGFVQKFSKQLEDFTFPLFNTVGRINVDENEE